jgi:regulation of enolase protein 1 (concanavalin A-like superfamily)|tara:strand:+ start:72 stop:641 length:570 start_codon:yes stop_codon:yes gene_type:complete
MESFMPETQLFHDPLTPKLDASWSWLREDSDHWRITDKGLEVLVEPGVKDTVKNALLRPGPDRSSGTFAIEVTIHNQAVPTNQYEQAGITLYVDGEPVFKEVKELIDGDLYIIPGKKPMSTSSVRLRLIVTATSWEAQFCPEGGDGFKTAATGELPEPSTDQVSIQCYNGPNESDHWVRFEDFRILQME